MQVGTGPVMAASLIFADLQRTGGTPRSWLFNGCKRGGYILRPGAVRVLCGNAGGSGASCHHSLTWKPGRTQLGESIPDGLRKQAYGVVWGRPVANELVIERPSTEDAIEATFGKMEGGFRVTFDDDWDNPFS